MSEKSWLQLVCSTSKAHHKQIETLMEDAGALSITWQNAEDEPVLEPLPGETPLWNNLIITALFDSDTDLTATKEQLKNNQSNREISDFYIETIHDQDWERVWMKDFHPMCFGDNLWIIPSTANLAEVEKLQKTSSNPTSIILDPGLAFGTGTHPTTALCLEWLDQNPPQKLSVVDYGCGSGVLAIAAAKLGAKNVIATDIDPQAITATKENMRRNQINSAMIPCYLPDAYPAVSVDLVLANILCGPLIELFPRLSSTVKPGGHIVISGLLSSQKEDIIKAYSAEFSDFKIKQLDDWVRISATKNDN